MIIKYEKKNGTCLTRCPDKRKLGTRVGSQYCSGFCGKQLEHNEEDQLVKCSHEEEVK